MITIDELKFKLGGLETAVNDLRDALSIEASEKRLAELEHQMTLPGFYDDQEKSQKVISEMGEVKNKLERFGKLSTQYEEAQTLLEMIEEENDPSLAAEGEEAVNGELVSYLTRLMNKNGVVWQIGEMGRLDLGGGGTIAKYVANRDIDTIDIGVPVLAMHSPFEVVSKADVYMAYRTFRAFCTDAE